MQGLVRVAGAGTRGCVAHREAATSQGTRAAREAQKCHARTPASLRSAQRSAPVRERSQMVPSASWSNWSGRQDSNLRSPAPKAGALATTLRPAKRAPDGAGGPLGADDGNRTRVASLEDWGSTIELHPRTAEACAQPDGGCHGATGVAIPPKPRPDPPTQQRSAPVQDHQRAVVVARAEGLDQPLDARAVEARCAAPARPGRAAGRCRAPCRGSGSPRVRRCRA